MKSHPIWIVALSGVLFLAPACDREDYTSTPTAQAGDKAYSYEQREDFRRDMDIALQKLDARVEELKVKAASATEDAKEGFQTLIDDAKVRSADLRRELSEIGSSTREGWNDFTRKFRSSMDDLGRRLEDAFD